MTAKVIASRLKNLDVKTNEKDVADILETSEGIFKESHWDRTSPINNDRQPNEKAYCLHPAIIDTLDKDADNVWYDFLSKRNPFTRKEYILFHSVFSVLIIPATILLIMVYFYYTNPADLT